MSLRDELIATLKHLDLWAGPDFDDHASLIKSGMLDSLALLKLALWIEEKIDDKLDPATFELAKEWDSIAKILDFIERRHGNRIAEVGMDKPGHRKLPSSRN